MAHSKLVAVLAAASIPLTTAQAHADVEEHLVFLGSVDAGTAVWEAATVPGEPVVLAEFDDGARQHWYWDPEAGTFKNALTLRCLTAGSGAVWYAPCEAGSDGQRWERQPVGDPNTAPSLFENALSGTCVTHGGVGGQLVLQLCDLARADQQWNIFLV